MRFLVLLVPALIALLGACAPQVGDACVRSEECDLGQVCDTSTPRGYCTQFECTANSCPGDSVCVDFGDVQACMERCSQSSECRQRDGHECRDDLGPTAFCYLPPEDDLSSQ